QITCNAGAFVFHRHLYQLFTRASSTEPDDGTFRRILRRVVDQRVDDFAHGTFIDTHPRQLFFNVQLHAMLARHWLCSRQSGGDDLVHSAPATSQLQLACFDTSKFDQSTNEPAQTIALFVDYFHHLDSRLR